MPLKKKIKNLLNFLLRIGLSLGLIVFLLRKIDFRQVFSLIRTADLAYLSLAAFLFLICNTLLLLRWNLLIKGLDVHIPFSQVVRSFFIGLFFNVFLPSSAGGDVARIINIFSHTPHRARAVASVVLDRLSGFISLVLICGVSLILGYKYVNDSSIYLILAAFLFLLVGMIFVLFSRRLFSWVSRIFSKAPHIANKLTSLNDSFVFFRNRYGVIAISIIISIVAQVVFFWASYYIIRSFHTEVGMIYFMIFIPIITLVTSLPISMGGLGVRDASSVYFFNKVGVSSSMALGLSLMSFVFVTGVGLLGGLVYVLTLPSKRNTRSMQV